MHPGLLEFLDNNKMNVGESLDTLNDRHYEVLSSLTGIKRSKEEASKIMKGSFRLTGDGLLKMLAIFVRGVF